MKIFKATARPSERGSDAWFTGQVSIRSGHRLRHTGNDYFQIDGQPARTLMTGDAFYEPANAKILHFDNASEQDRRVLPRSI